MADVVFFKVKILRTNLKPMDYPDFNKINESLRGGGQDWAIYLDRWTGQHLDKISEMGTIDEVNADPDVQFCIYASDAPFAKEAKRLFSDRIEILEEADAKDFYDNRSHQTDLEQKVNADVMNNLRAKYGLEGNIQEADTSKMDVADQNALNPDHPAPGVVTNKEKTFDGFKQNRGLNIIKKADVEKDIPKTPEN